MSDMTDHERRISAALARIGAGLERLGQRAAPATAAEADDALREALETERAANAQLSERVRAIREKQETTLGALERKLAAAKTEIEQNLRDLVRMKRANADLAAANRALADAAEAGLADPQLVNRTMQAELAALRAERAAEVAELDDILAGLAPLVEATEQMEAGHA
ncbi:hypothetical protein [Phaeovulum sp.]|uniref:hypothetical protein n=1 Tax=Phaeovulum sp. TaxID=2934796 RepID=UPI00272FE924|nr:hypothetical protein [Phaeovulum sp.]MDP1667665.1 hypothetical protein [Phaeovulum sp.]MDZ4118444.1 hypothetical protein [Phaeovulum sp.]